MCLKWVCYIHVLESRLYVHVHVHVHVHFLLRMLGILIYVISIFATCTKSIII